MAERGRARRLAGEEGFTLFELLIAMAVTAVGLLALVSSFDQSRDLVSLAEKTEVAAHQAERQMERVLSLPYAQVAHRTAPTHSTDTASPRFYVASGGGSYQWDQGSTGPQSGTLVVDATNGSTLIDAQEWVDSESRLEGEIHTFITQTGDLCPATVTGCPSGDQRGKRVTVAVTVEGPRPLRRPVLISSLKVDPTATGGS
jgi:prepilin-type N-terminal cleavage/methylation domain-containing protein